MWAVLGGFCKRVLAWALGNFLGRVLVGAGLALVTYKFAVDPLFDQIESLVVSNAGQLALDWFGFFKIDKAITVIGSAYGIRVAAKSVKVAQKS